MHGVYLATLFGFVLVGMMVVTVFYAVERKIVSINETLLSIKASLSEATTELVGKIQELQAQLASSETVDPALLDEVKGLADGLAGVVENVPDEVAPEPVTPEEPVVTPEEPVVTPEA